MGYHFPGKIIKFTNESHLWDRKLNKEEPRNLTPKYIGNLHLNISMESKCKVPEQKIWDMLVKIISKGDRLHQNFLLTNVFPIEHFSVPNKEFTRKGYNTSALYNFNKVDGTTNVQNTR